MGRSIGVDIGGSGVRGALVEAGRLGEIRSIPLADRRPETVVSVVSQVIDTLGIGGPVGVCVPGFVQSGVVRSSPNFPGWRDLPLALQLSQAQGRPVALMNDANAAALGAWTSRGEREDLVLLALGTGVGGGVVVDGRPLTGSGGTGAELGHIFVGGDRLCGCGARGCLETWVSTTGLVAAALAQGHSCHSGLEVMEAADRGERWAAKICDGAADALGRGLVTLVNIFNPDTILLTGGLAGARHRLEPRALGILNAQGIGPSVERVELVWGPRAEEYSILGASRNALEQRT